MPEQDRYKDKVFEVWLRTVCFQEPTKEAKDLALTAWTNQKDRIATLEKALREIRELPSVQMDEGAAIAHDALCRG